MSMLLRYLELLNRGLARVAGSPGGWPPASQMRPDALPGLLPEQPRGLLASMHEDDRPRGLLGLIEEPGLGQVGVPPASTDEESPSDKFAQTVPDAVAGTLNTGAVPPVPAHKREVLKESDWAAFHRAMERLQGLGPNARSAFARTFAEEGGMKPNANGGAVAGIMPDTFGEIKRSRRIPELAAITSVSQLTPELAALIYRDIANQRMRTVGGAAALEQIDSDTSGALYDSIFQHGGAGGTGYVQDAINNIMDELPEAERRRLTVGPILRDEKMGPETFGAFRALIQGGPDLAARLRRALAEERKKPRKGRPKEPGELLRFDRFR